LARLKSHMKGNPVEGNSLTPKDLLSSYDYGYVYGVSLCSDFLGESINMSFVSCLVVLEVSFNFTTFFSPK